jgi:hypothetical protein
MEKPRACQSFSVSEEIGKRERKGETLMSEMLKVTREELDADSNPKIEKAGSAKFGSKKYCTWETAGGTESSLIVTNKGKNMLMVSISGAPADVKTEDGEFLNGRWKIPANRTDLRIEAHGDYKRSTVTIFNTSDPSTDCEVLARL